MKKKYPDNWIGIATAVKRQADWCCENCGQHNDYPGRVLTVHHVDYDTFNNTEDNLVALCQSCHLKAQGMIVQARNKHHLLRRMAAQGHQVEML